MKISIVIAVLDSPEIVRRQILHFYNMPLLKDVEIILVDDKSNPPLKEEDYRFDQLRIFRHNIRAQWTQPAARNYGVKQASGEYIIVTDIDHILCKALIDNVYNTKYDFIRFKREVAVLDEFGHIIQTPEAVFKYGFEKQRYMRKGFRIQPHTNSFAMKRQLYLDLGGVSEKHVGTSKYPNREETPLKRKVRELGEKGEISIIPDDERPIIYMIPNGRFCGDKNYNPFNLFHSLSR